MNFHDQTSAYNWIQTPVKQQEKVTVYNVVTQKPTKIEATAWLKHVNTCILSWQKHKLEIMLKVVIRSKIRNFILQI
jgi:hypothetical protein